MKKINKDDKNYVYYYYYVVTGYDSLYDVMHDSHMSVNIGKVSQMIFLELTESHSFDRHTTTGPSIPVL